MAIYRGPGGAGDATGDATNASALALAAKDEAQASATSAASSATAAASSASSASTSASDASTSATNAAGSATTASTAATNASTYATNASDSATEAAASASDAADSATAAASSATSASTDASTASTQASNASSSASSASTSASTATTKASEAATSATNAASSASAAATSETNAASSASAASTSETNAASSASSASTSASNASTSASTATTQATNAASSASAAATSETNAASSASAASTSASNASTSATNAANSATSAASSATAAAASAVTAATFDPALYLAKSGNLSGLANTATARDNLGVEIGVDVQAFNAALAAIAANNGTNMMKNRIINGAMAINQRGAVDTPVTPNNDYVTADRWSSINTQTGKYTFQQSSTAPAGFKYSLLVTSSSSYSVGSGDTFGVSQSIEGYNVADMGFGAAGAATVTISFWVRSSLTGTFAGAIRNSAGDRSYPFTFTINSANTFEQKSVTITGDTSGTWLTTNGRGIVLSFNLGSGSTYSTTAGAWAAGNYLSATGAVSLVGTNAATLYIAGVQLEKGSTATSFDYRPYGTELALCQRYFISYGGTTGYERFAVGLCNGTGSVSVCTFLPVPMRSVPTLGYSSAGNFGVYDGGNVYTVTSLTLDQATNQVANYGATVASGLTQYRPAEIVGNNTTSARLTLSAEL